MESFLDFTTFSFSTCGTCQIFSNAMLALNCAFSTKISKIHLCIYIKKHTATCIIDTHGIMQEQRSELRWKDRKQISGKTIRDEDSLQKSTQSL